MQGTLAEICALQGLQPLDWPLIYVIILHFERVAGGDNRDKFRSDAMATATTNWVGVTEVATPTRSTTVCTES